MEPHHQLQHQQEEEASSNSVEPRHQHQHQQEEEEEASLVEPHQQHQQQHHLEEEASSVEPHHQHQHQHQLEEEASSAAAKAARWSSRKAPGRNATRDEPHTRLHRGFNSGGAATAAVVKSFSDARLQFEFECNWSHEPALRKFKYY